jgi:hypothetical protein
MYIVVSVHFNSDPYLIPLGFESERSRTRISLKKHETKKKKKLLGPQTLKITGEEVDGVITAELMLIATETSSPPDEACIGYSVLGIQNQISTNSGQ